ncbi:MAG: DUF3575 domain-containing protein [Alistipes sp.]|jgi:hypothetical protein|nr:DUF3575 domain-containing protein [Alistipes sp.]
MNNIYRIIPILLAALFFPVFVSAQDVVETPRYEMTMIREGSAGGTGTQYLPRVAVKTNLLVMATATANVSLEVGLARRWTTDIAVGYNPFKLQQGGTNQIWFTQPELRYWFCQRFEGHFIGLHGIYGQYNVGKVGFLTDTFRLHRYKGWGVGGGIAWGYHLPMSRRWSWEFSLGVGYVWLNHDKYDCYDCERLIKSDTRHYLGPTKVGVSLVYMIK